VSDDKQTLIKYAAGGLAALVGGYLVYRATAGTAAPEADEAKPTPTP